MSFPGFLKECAHVFREAVGQLKAQRRVSYLYNLTSLPTMVGKCTDFIQKMVYTDSGSHIVSQCNKLQQQLFSTRLMIVGHVRDLNEDCRCWRRLDVAKALTWLEASVLLSSQPSFTYR